MNPEINFRVMQTHVNELREAAEQHRMVREVEKANKSERRHRSFFGKRRPE